jgi:hypothetical protein
MTNQNRLTDPAAVADRRARIFLRMQEGWSYEAIAAEEELSRERVRQIVKDELSEREAEPDQDHQRLQAARLDPALRLAAEKVAEGDLRAIDKLVRVLNQLDKYRADGKRRPASAGLQPVEDDTDYREILLRKLNEVEARRAALKDWTPPSRESFMEPKPDPIAAHDDVAKFFPPEAVEKVRNGKT